MLQDENDDKLPNDKNLYNTLNETRTEHDQNPFADSDETSRTDDGSREQNINVNPNYSVVPPAIPLSDDRISYRGEEYEKPLSIGKWFLTIILLAIPVVNLIMLIVWLATDSNVSRKNYLIAYLLAFVAEMVLTIFIVVCFTMLMLSAM